jgi:arylsulfatase A-like enzyme/Tfp pilus assembly protein PilF
VVIITLDTTRADHLGCYGHDGIETPNFDRLAAEGILYENALTPVPITLPSHTSIFTGTYPVFHGVRENGGFYVPNELETMAEILNATGYATAAFVGSFPLDSQTGLDQGFELYDDNYPDGSSRRHPSMRGFYPERPASEVADAAVAWLADQGDRPFFLWTHYFDPHQPLTPPSPYRERYPAAPYDAEIAFVDEAVGRTLDALKDQGFDRNTIVILVGDHGESLGEHGEMTHAVLLYSATMRVPLIIRDPSISGARRITSRVSTVDIFPTVLHRLGLPLPPVVQGHELPDQELPEAADRAFYGESLYGNLLYGWSPLDRLTRGRWMLIRSPHENRLFDLEADPLELVDLASDHPDQAAELARLADQKLQMLSDGKERFSQGTISAENQARLEALGYLGSPREVEEGENIRDIDAGPDPHDMMEVLSLIMEGRNLAQRGVNELAIPVLERAENQDPDNPWIVRELAMTYLTRGQYEEARIAADRLLDLGAEHVQTLLVLAEYERARGDMENARAHLGLDQITDAESEYRGILSISPTETLALNGLATLLLKQQRIDEGVELLERLRVEQPYFPAVYLNLGVVAYEGANYSESLRLTRRSLTLRPRQIKAMELEAMNLEAVGEEDQALGVWQGVLAAAADDQTRERAKAAIERLL